VVLGGTLIPVDRLAAERPFYSGKHKRPRQPRRSPPFTNAGYRQPIRLLSVSEEVARSFSGRGVAVTADPGARECPVCKRRRRMPRSR
jgi:hypothetical protein